MPLYTGTIYKRFKLQPTSPLFVNTYTLNAASESAALTLLASVQDLEANVFWDIIEFTRLAVRLKSSLATAGRQVQISEEGERDSTDKQFLPSFNTVRVILSDDVGRPDMKYLRLPLWEDEQNNGLLDPVLVSFIAGNYAIPLTELDGVVSSNGLPYTGMTVWPDVQMRQRGWHRRSRPGQKRGWVPA